MTIADLREKCNALRARLQASAQASTDLLLVGILVFACLASFGLGFLAGRDTRPGQGIVREDAPAVDALATGQVVASKGGTKYYFAWCAGAERISERNKVWFASAEAAAAAGYAPAAHCKGL